MVKLKPSGGKDFLFQFVETQHMPIFFKKELKSGKCSIATSIVKKNTSCSTKMAVALNLCQAHPSTFFELEKYKTELGKEFKRITLYLCTSNDLESSQESENVCDDTTDQDFCEEEISSHVHGDRHIPIDEADQIESDMKLAQVIQCEWDGYNITETDPKSTEDIFKGLVAKVNDEKEFLIATRRKADLTRKLYLWQRQTKRIHQLLRLECIILGKME